MTQVVRFSEVTFGEYRIENDAGLVLTVRPESLSIEGDSSLAGLLESRWWWQVVIQRGCLLLRYERPSLRPDPLSRRPAMFGWYPIGRLLGPDAYAAAVAAVNHLLTEAVSYVVACFPDEPVEQRYCGSFNPETDWIKPPNRIDRRLDRRVGSHEQVVALLNEVYADYASRGIYVSNLTDLFQPEDSIAPSTARRA